MFIQGRMDLEIFINQVGDALGDLPEGPLVPETEFKALKAWDSLGILTVTDTVETEYGVLLRREDYNACQTLEALFQRVQSRR